MPKTKKPAINEERDYLRVWTVEFAELWNENIFTRKSVSAWSATEAIDKAQRLVEQRGVDLKVRNVFSGPVLDA